ncbi:MAG: uroporphyrinogen decarboxylase family protein [Phycisphaeraceae bacterium]|nr:uroporphyrinogen decarboxylase family protein [Phycisphaeraceae bacterium]MDP7346690.1 uroporphyrinogen decarboxylase family protein [Phycisphaeraceae bacterium]
MNRRERVLAAIDHCQPDVLPVGFKATDDVLNMLQRHFGVDDLNDLLDILDVDTYGNINNCLYGVYPDYVGGPPKVLYPDSYPDGSWDTIYGYKRHWVPFAGGRNDEVISRPLADATIDDLDQHDWPQVDWFDVSTIRQQCDQVGDRANLFNLGGLGHVGNLIGLERLMTDMLLDPPFIEDCLRRVTDFYVELLDRVLAAADGGIDVVAIHDDFGTQHGPLMGFDEYRRFFKPNHRLIFDVAHRHGVKAMMHSCGAVFDFVPDFIEIGADILDPIQTTAAGMDPARLKQTYGTDVCLHGGIDTQNTLIHGSPDDVRRHIDELISAMEDGGGFILAPSHYMQADIPLANVLTIFEHVRQYR